MARRNHRQVAIRTAVLALLLPILSMAQGGAPPPLGTRAGREAFLSTAKILDETPPPPTAGRVWRITLDDGTRTHGATVATSVARDPSGPDYRFNIAAYELDKVLDLGLVAPSIERIVNGQPAAVTWWVDDFLMSEVDRRRRNLDPLESQSWNAQMQAVRVFDELVDNAYRDVSPDAYSSTVWDNLLITRGWQIWLIDHTRTFGTSGQLKHPESLTRCDRTMFGKLRQLNEGVLTGKLGKYLTADRLRALERRRVLIVSHYDERVARYGEAAVLYDLTRRP
jgi:hypothetical protein